MGEHDWLSIATQYDPWDVLVIGAGPAGAIASRQLALGGYRVLLVDKSPFPRQKVCGGCLGGAALDVLDRIGLAHLPLAIGGVPLRSLRLASGGESATIAVGRRIAVARDTLDTALVRESLRCGSQFLANTKATLNPCDDMYARTALLQLVGQEVTVRARAVLIASGLSSCPAQFKIEKVAASRIGLGVVLETANEFGEPDQLLMACGSRGYVGVAPVDGRRLDVAAAVDSAALTAAGSPGRLIDDILREAGLPGIPGLEVAAWRGTPALTRTTRPLAAHRCLIVGDAAGYVEPFTGEGIGWAMQSAVLAGEFVQRGLNHWEPGIADDWDRAYAAAMFRPQRNCRWVTRLLRSRAVRQAAMWSLRRAPSIAVPVVRRLDRSLA